MDLTVAVTIVVSVAFAIFAGWIIMKIFGDEFDGGPDANA